MTGLTAVTGVTGVTVRALPVDDLNPLGSLPLNTPVAIALGVALVLAVVCVVLVVLMSRPRRVPRVSRPRGAHAVDGTKNVWRARVDDVVAQYHEGTLERQEAFCELAAVARDFASVASGQNLAASTLTDITTAPRTSADRRGLELLRVTITALYPPEFADHAMDAQARAVSVEEAAGWVSSLIERWRR